MVCLVLSSTVGRACNHANYKIIDSNVIDWENITKIHTPPSAKCYFPSPPEEHVLYKDNFATRNDELSKVIADIKTAAKDR